MKLKVFFAWYDCWVGWFYDQNKKILYVCPLPMLVLQINFHRLTNDEIDQKVEAWHRSNSAEVIWRYIGISRAEYSAWVELKRKNR